MSLCESHPAPDVNARTMEVVSDVGGFEGMRTPCHQACYPPNTPPVNPRERELSEVKTVR